LKRSLCFFNGNEKALLVQLSERLTGFDHVIEVDEDLGHSPGKLRTDIDGDLGIDRTGCFHQSRNCAALYRSSKEGGSFTTLIVGVTKPHAHRTQQKRCNCWTPHFHLRRWSEQNPTLSPQRRSYACSQIFRPKDPAA